MLLLLRRSGTTGNELEAFPLGLWVMHGYLSLQCLSRRNGITFYGLRACLVFEHSNHVYSNRGLAFVVRVQYLLLTIAQIESHPSQHPLTHVAVSKCLLLPKGSSWIAAISFLPRCATTPTARTTDRLTQALSFRYRGHVGREVIPFHVCPFFHVALS